MQVLPNLEKPDEFLGLGYCVMSQFVAANDGSLVTVVGKIGAIDLEAKTVRIDLTAVSHELAVLGKAQAVVKL
jgi:hypothetical protein